MFSNAMRQPAVALYVESVKGAMINKQPGFALSAPIHLMSSCYTENKPAKCHFLQSSKYFYQKVPSTVCYTPTDGGTVQLHSVKVTLKIPNKYS